MVWWFVVVVLFFFFKQKTAYVMLISDWSSDVCSSDLDPSGPERYAYAEHRDYLDALWEALDLGDRVVLVVHDWGSVLGFDWARRHRERVQGIAYMEAVTMPLEWADFPEQARD